MLIYADSCVFVAAVQGLHWGNTASVKLLEEHRRQLVTSALVRLETISALLKAQDVTMRDRREMARLASIAFDHVPRTIDVHQRHVVCALDFVLAYPALAPVDAIHAALAVDAGAEFVTLEKRSKPLSLIPDLRFRSIHSDTGF